MSRRECPKCADWMQHAQRLERRLRRVMAQLTAAEARIGHLEERLAGATKDSSNSSKPPSSDLVKPPAQKPFSGQRRRGGQVGHAPQQRPPFEPGQIDAVERHAYEACPRCGGRVEQLPTPAQVLQQVERVAKPIRVTEHHSCTCRCPACGEDFIRPLPPQIAAAGTFGPRLTAWVAYLKGACHASFSTIEQLLRETCGLRIARGTLAKLCQKVAQSLQVPYEQLRRQVPQQTTLHIDETSHRENGQWQWTWVFRAPQFTLFHIDPARSAQVLEDLLGEGFCGTLLVDYYSAYHRYLARHPQASAQFCLAHLVRDARFLETLPDQANRQFGAALLGELRELFRRWHARSQPGQEAAWRAALIAQGERLVQVATEQAPPTRQAWNLARRFERHADQYLRFTQAAGLEPTNNVAERAIRQVVIDRHVTQGTRSPKGRTWCQRIWTRSPPAVSKVATYSPSSNNPCLPSSPTPRPHSCSPHPNPAPNQHPPQPTMLA
jgi:transposase